MSDKVVIEFSQPEIQAAEAALMDSDAQEALRWLKEVLKPKLRAKGSSALSADKPVSIG